jgi:hypothetical protein
MSDLDNVIDGVAIPAPGFIPRGKVDASLPQHNGFMNCRIRCLALHSCCSAHNFVVEPVHLRLDMRIRCAGSVVLPDLDLLFRRLVLTAVYGRPGGRPGQGLRRRDAGEQRG